MPLTRAQLLAITAILEVQLGKDARLVNAAWQAHNELEPEPEPQDET